MRTFTLCLGMFWSFIAQSAVIDMSFSSFGAGIDYNAFHAVSEILDEELSSGRVTNVDREYWGMEGEVDLIITTQSCAFAKQVIKRLDHYDNAKNTRLTLRTCNDILPPYTGLACTKDLNSWGNPSNCMCGDQTYNPKAGLCDSPRKSGNLFLGSKLDDQITFKLVSYDKLVTTVLVFPKDLEETAFYFAKRNFPVGVSGSFSVIYTKDLTPVLVFDVETIDIEE